MSKLWGARFDKASDKLADAFSFSISYDCRLAQYDIVVGIAHARMLGQCKIIPQKDAGKIITGLKKIADQLEKGTFVFDPKAEDIHSNIQSALKKDIGVAADKLHTARSRNDLIVTDMKLYCQDEIIAIIHCITKLQEAIVACARDNVDVIIPAYTHLQAAQVVLFPHYLLAYVHMLERDLKRLVTTECDIIDSLPLGSCALSGTSLPINRNTVAKELAFLTPSENSIDAVSSRDFIVSLLSNLATLGVHCSRIAEDFIIWATSEFNFIDIDSSLCTGSSIMPHKKNPDILELIRGESARLISNLNEILILTKGLPLTYNRDLQLDKPPLFASIDKIKMILPLLTKLFQTLKVKKDVLMTRTQDEYFFSVDVMEYLIAKGASYREAHDSVGRIVKDGLDHGKSIACLSKAELKAYHPKLDVDVKKLLNPESSVKIKKSIGSTNPKMVHQELNKWKKKLSR